MRGTQEACLHRGRLEGGVDIFPAPTGDWFERVELKLSGWSLEFIWAGLGGCLLADT